MFHSQQNNSSTINYRILEWVKILLESCQIPSQPSLIHAILIRSTSNLSASASTTVVDLRTPRKSSQHRKKKRRKAENRRRLSDGSTSSDADNAERRSCNEGGTTVTKGLLNSVWCRRQILGCLCMI